MNSISTMKNISKLILIKN